MKFLFALFFLIIVTMSAFADFPAGYPTKEVYQIKTDLDLNEADVLVLQNKGSDTYTTDGERFGKVLQVTWSATDDGGVASTAYDLSQNLPAGAIVREVWGQVVASITASDSNTITLIATPGLTLYPATNLGSASVGALIAGNATGTLTSAIYNSTEKDIIAVVGTGTAGLTSGELKFNIRYDMGEAGL